MSDTNIVKAGEQGVVVEFGNVIDPGVNARVHRLAQLIASDMPDEILELVPTYRSLMVYFDPQRINREALSEKIRLYLESGDQSGDRSDTATVVSIPVCYGGDFGPDLDFVASHNKLSTQEVVQIHTSRAYQVYMLGFTPGFPYLGGMSDRIAAPRLAQPRVVIPAGSVGIAGSQTGIYPIESPGGWQLIGRTPLQIFSPGSANPFLFAAGNFLRFTAIDAETFLDIRRQVESGSYLPVTGTIERGGDAACAL
ncbi:5-oxoprolinase subunit PxpB [Geomonas azotofigens]|uniref:5-oxoprolinase subunit PxpB n=1 Tax=Geomonas azotofigens TaxID=2843196 RepID=UPI001C112CDF|nr:5-oxoprolinase subunit PxpB [Geomonas azotofigens]MBU5612860.1 5-oxoprolinase subunit PxpB [Geomonas azotofigens]